MDDMEGDNGVSGCRLVGRAGVCVCATHRAEGRISPKRSTCLCSCMQALIDQLAVHALA